MAGAHPADQVLRSWYFRWSTFVTTVWPDTDNRLSGVELLRARGREGLGGGSVVCVENPPVNWLPADMGVDGPLEEVLSIS